jgi:hypothetical protein
LLGLKQEKACWFSALFHLYAMSLFAQDRPTPRLIRLNTNKTKKTKKSILAIPAAPAAIPPNPSTPAMMATIRNITVHLSMIDK